MLDCLQALGIKRYTLGASMEVAHMRENVGHTSEGVRQRRRKSWQGWVALAAFFGPFGVGFLIFPPNKELGLLLAYVALLSTLLIVICWLKGEPPRWRWGSGEGA